MTRRNHHFGWFCASLNVLTFKIAPSILQHCLVITRWQFNAEVSVRESYIEDKNYGFSALNLDLKLFLVLRKTY